MSDTNLHPSIQEFRQFVQQHPKLIQEVRQNRTGWQPYYEKWVLLGEEDPSWQAYKNGQNANAERETAAEAESEAEQTEKESEETGKEMFNKVMGMANQLDLQKLQGHIHHLNGALENIKQLIGQYQGVKQQFPSKKKTPTFFHKD